MEGLEEIGVPAPCQFVEVDGVRLAVAREGRGVPVVCLHAIGHGGRDFEAFTAATKDAFDIVRIDWPGQGRSGPDTQMPTPQRYAMLLDSVLRTLKVERPIIIGNSIGGATAIRYAGDHQVRALVLCDPGGLFEITPALARICRAFSRFFGAGARGAWWYGGAFWFYYRFLVLPGRAATAQRRRIIAAGRLIAPVLRDAWAGFGNSDADLRATAAALDVPVWFAWSKSDRLIQLSAARPAIKAMKRATLTTFGGGHAAFLEKPKAFAAAFRKFAKGLEKYEAEGAKLLKSA